MSSLTDLRFFTTPSHDCSYIDGKKAVTLFVDPAAEIDTPTYTELSAVGFRRSGTHLYRPYCESCSACIPVRIPVANFVHQRRQRRITRRNDDVRIALKEARFSEEHYVLYARYINERHQDGDMFPPSPEQFRSFLVDGRPEAVFVEMRDAEDRLLAIAVVDRLEDSLSAIYTFFDPDCGRRSLGVFAVLSLISMARDLHLPYLYLGYWIKQCQKMSYKTDYQPIELFIDNRWLPLDR